MKLRTAMFTTILSGLVLSALSSATYAGYYDNNSNDKKSYGNNKETAVKTSAVVSKVETSQGEVFANSEGKTLYTFTKDSQATSNCYGGCAASWPPFYAKKNAQEWGAFTVIERKDNTYQWAYNHQPLYTWVGDQKKGDTNGHGVNQVWFVLPAAK